MTGQPPAYDGPFRFQGGTADIDKEWIDIDTVKAWLRRRQFLRVAPASLIFLVLTRLDLSRDDICTA